MKTTYQNVVSALQRYLTGGYKPTEQQIQQVNAVVKEPERHFGQLFEGTCGGDMGRAWEQVRECQAKGYDYYGLCAIGCYVAGRRVSIRGYNDDKVDYYFQKINKRIK